MLTRWFIAGPQGPRLWLCQMWSSFSFTSKSNIYRLEIPKFLYASITSPTYIIILTNHTYQPHQPTNQPTNQPSNQPQTNLLLDTSFFRLQRLKVSFNDGFTGGKTNDLPFSTKGIKAGIFRGKCTMGGGGVFKGFKRATVLCDFLPGVVFKMHLLLK